MEGEPARGPTKLYTLPAVRGACAHGTRQPLSLRTGA